ncbi:hypothetical protein pb186bvf_002170 [Paramecium bursaria]
MYIFIFLYDYLLISQRIIYNNQQQIIGVQNNQSMR